MLFPVGSRVFLPSDADSVSQFALLFKRGDRPSFSWLMSRQGPLLLIALSVLDTPRAGKFGVVRVSEILGKRERTSLEQRIMSSLQWSGRASTAIQREEAFPLFAIALEALLLGNREHGELSFKFSTRGALLLMKSFDGRKRVKGELASLYKRRSAIVHSGSTEISDKELSAMRWYSKQAVLTVLTTSPFTAMCHEDEFDSWLDEQMLGGGGVEKNV